MNKFSSMFGQMLQIFSKMDFYAAVKETKSAKGQRDLPVGTSLSQCFSASWVRRIPCVRSVGVSQAVWAN
jgi:hypothetical protein